MGTTKKKVERNRSKTLPSSPTHSSSSSSSDFEFRISISPRKSSASLCPADELFYKGQLLPLHLSPRISMVRTLTLASSSTSSSAATTTTASRDSSSSTDSTSSSFAADLSLLAPGFSFDPSSSSSSRPSSVDDDVAKIVSSNNKPPSKYSFSLSRIFKHKDNHHPKDTTTTTNNTPNNKKMISSTAKEVIRKYLKKVKPLYDKLSHKNQRDVLLTSSVTSPASLGPERTASAAAALLLRPEAERSDRGDVIVTTVGETSGNGITANTATFSGSLKGPRRRGYVASCPSSMRSSPSHSGVLTRGGLPCRGVGHGGGGGGVGVSSDTSTMEELQNAIQGAIAHCKNSMLQQNTSTFNNNNNNNSYCNGNNGNSRNIGKNKCKAVEI